MMTDQDLYDFCESHLASNPNEVRDLIQAYHKIKGTSTQNLDSSTDSGKETFRVCVIRKLNDIQSLDTICRVLPDRDRWKLLLETYATGWIQDLTLVEARELIDSDYFSWLPVGTLGSNGTSKTVWTWNGQGWFSPEGWPNNPCYPVHPILPWPHV